MESAGCMPKTLRIFIWSLFLLLSTAATVYPATTKTLLSITATKVAPKSKSIGNPTILTPMTTPPASVVFGYSTAFYPAAKPIQWEFLINWLRSHLSTAWICMITTLIFFALILALRQLNFLRMNLVANGFSITHIGKICLEFLIGRSSKKVKNFTFIFTKPVEAELWLMKCSMYLCRGN